MHKTGRFIEKSGYYQPYWIFVTQCRIIQCFFVWKTTESLCLLFFSSCLLYLRSNKKIFFSSIQRKVHCSQCAILFILSAEKYWEKKIPNENKFIGCKIHNFWQEIKELKSVRGKFMWESKLQQIKVGLGSFSWKYMRERKGTFQLN